MGHDRRRPLPPFLPHDLCDPTKYTDELDDENLSKEERIARLVARRKKRIEEDLKEFEEKYGPFEKVKLCVCGHLPNCRAHPNDLKEDE